MTALLKIVSVENKTAEHIAQKFSQSWLARYPWPELCIHDNGGEFTGYAFQRLLRKTHIKDVPITSRNPQANSICKRMHQTVGNTLRILLHDKPSKQKGNAKE